MRSRLESLRLSLLEVSLRDNFERTYSISLMVVISVFYSFIVRRRKRGRCVPDSIKIPCISVFKEKLLVLTCLHESAVDYTGKSSRKL